MDGISEVTPGPRNADVIALTVSKNSTYEKLKNFSVSEKKLSIRSEMM